jgi:hypothetical protein
MISFLQGEKLEKLQERMWTSGWFEYFIDVKSNLIVDIVASIVLRHEKTLTAIVMFLV